MIKEKHKSSMFMDQTVLRIEESSSIYHMHKDLEINLAVLKMAKDLLILVRRSMFCLGITGGGEGEKTATHLLTLLFEAAHTYLSFILL